MRKLLGYLAFPLALAVIVPALLYSRDSGEVPAAVHNALVDLAPAIFAVSGGITFFTFCEHNGPSRRGVTVLVPGRNDSPPEPHPRARLGGRCRKCGCEFVARGSEAVASPNDERDPFVVCPTKGCPQTVSVYPIEC